MTSYRLYSIDGAGKIVGAQWLDAPSDHEAVDVARTLNIANKCEVWNRTKLVRCIEPALPTIAQKVIMPAA